MKLFQREALQGKMDIEKSFKEQFVTTFLATWVAKNYDDYVQFEMHDRLADPPVEDAEHLANTAWEKVVDLIVEAPEEK